MCLGALFAFAFPGMTEDYDFDTVHSQIHFSVSHLGFSNSYGSFSDFNGVFSFDPEAPEQSRVDVTIKTSSLDMDDATWNSHLMGEQWFNISEYPTIRFASDKVESVGVEELRVAGRMTMLGVTKPATLDVTLNKIGMQMGVPKAGFSATATIDRTDWGMTTFAPMIGTDVAISIEVEAVVASDNPATRFDRVVPPKVVFYEYGDLTIIKPNEKIEVRTLFTQTGIVSQTRIMKDGLSPHHNHPEEETIVLISGRIKVVTADGERILEPGDVANIEPYAEHHFEGIENSFIIEVFGPGRVIGN